MKKINILMATILALSMSSCVQDLNTQPIDPNIKQTFNADEVYHKIYAGLGTSGQKGPDGDCDIVANDEGYSVWYRLVWVHNEFPCDGGWWIWNSDAGCSNLEEISWDSNNPFVKLLYNRLTFNVTTCNHFFDNTGGNPVGNDEATASDLKLHKMRAEVRFMRALNYAYLLDFFGNPPFVTTISMDNPKQFDKDVNVARPKLFAWIVEELNNCLEGLDEDTHVYKVNKNAVYLLLARLYLNSNVYHNGSYPEGALQKAIEYSDKIISKYPLAANYAQLFMGDNDVNPASQEVIFSIQQDGNETQSWGGSSYCVCATRAASMNPYGSTDAWTCWRATPELAIAFAGSKKPADLKKLQDDETTMPTTLKDDRALFNAKGNSFGGPAAYGTGNFEKCWQICKWTGVYSDGTKVGHNTQFVDTDLPIFRSAEAYLTKAEALYRQGNSGEALTVVNTIRSRAHAVALTSLDDDTFIDEWHREFYAEGRRRMDLIRFGIFTGKSTASGHRHWEGRGRKATGGISDVDAKYNLYPIPLSDCVANPELQQNPNY